jgi:hypothetical protein
MLRMEIVKELRDILDHLNKNFLEPDEQNIQDASYLLEHLIDELGD